MSAGGTAAGGGSRTGGLRRALRLAVLFFGLFVSAPGSAQTVSDAPNEITRDSVRVFYWGNASASAEQALDAALAPLPLPGIPSDAVLGRSTIILAPSRAIMDSIAQGRTPDWAAGIAIPSQRIIVIPTYVRTQELRDPVVTLRHELAHIALNEYLGGDVPRWFDEGYATWVSGGWDAGSGWQIRLALLRGNAPMLDSLSLAWPRGEGRARLAYLLSASAVRHLATSRGDQAFAAFFQRWRETGSMEPALRSVYQLNVPLFEREWRAMVRTRYGWLLAMTQLTVFWFAVSVLVFVLGSARRKRNRERLEELRKEEYMLPAVSEGGVDADYYPG